ncbi:1-hydroxycarotenoid 3,4-desaturase CrtD [Pontivivens insulae]|uniref:Hydroxyneurosporene desaturase n=1 Tax=Pontivivens insulae TaxID=1639689 RepID=A0A2R8AAA1_9RHOB|nr:1-hydroxycarotenoid 3,4-desaturase CrtD [Pontivivens insulae]RED12905.1 1-hydroxycarotenoid 3,4-desaturase [Pontivivens insulae]SPF28998.1 Hydroxyneurosporene desaturase [Pontivivens insulae]
MTRPRVLIIGAGLGGLAAALRLAHAGCDVTVHDRHPGPGGKMRTLPSAAGPVDAGPTVFTLRTVFEELFASVGERLDTHLDLVADRVVARHWWPDGSTLDLTNDLATNARAIDAFAGSRAAQQFERFSAETSILFDRFRAPVMDAPRIRLSSLISPVLSAPSVMARALRPGATLASALAARFDDPRLRQLFGRYATYVGGSPLASPALLALIWQAEAAGVWAIRGGMHKLAVTLTQLAEARGARFTFGSHIDELLFEGDRCVGLKTRDGSTQHADIVVFNGDPAALHQGALGQRARGAVRRNAASPRALSARVWSFAARANGLELAHHNVLFGRDPLSEFRDLAAGKIPSDPTLYICAQDRLADSPPGDLERFEIIANAPPLSQTRQESPPCPTAIFPTLARFGLSFDPQPDLNAVSTPADFAKAFPATDGSLYGRSPHGTMASFARATARSRIKGLYLAGGGVHPGPGIPMATRSGQHAAEAILSDLASTSTFRQTAMHGGMSTA